MAKNAGGTDSKKAAQRIKNFGAGAGMTDAERAVAMKGGKGGSRGFPPNRKPKGSGKK